MRKTVTEIAIEVLAERGYDRIWWGDIDMLDEIAVRAAHTGLASLHPLIRHTRTLDTLERSGRFSKGYITVSTRTGGGHRTRCLTLIHEGRA